MFALLRVLSCFVLLNYSKLRSVAGNPDLFYSPIEARSTGQPYYVERAVAVPVSQPSVSHIFHDANNINEMPQMPVPQIVVTPPEAEVHKQSNITNEIHEIFKALENGLQPPETDHERAAASRDYGGYSPYSTYSGHYGPYPTSSYYPSPYPAYQNNYQTPSANYDHIYSPPKPAPATPVAVPKPAVVKPLLPEIAPKVALLISGIQQILSGSAAPITGLPSKIISGILSKFLSFATSTSGLKHLIGKLAIPLVIILLVNVEIIGLIWWMWEDCPKIVTPSFPPYNPTYSSYAPKYRSLV